MNPTICTLLAIFFPFPLAGTDHLPPCEPGYTYVAETHYVERVVQVCKRVQDVKKIKKTVYDIKEERFCLPHDWLDLFGHKTCNDCGTPRCKRLLVKKEITEECPTTKCIVEKVIERVRYTVWRKVRCPDR